MKRISEADALFVFTSTATVGSEFSQFLGFPVDESCLVSVDSGPTGVGGALQGSAEASPRPMLPGGIRNQLQRDGLRFCHPPGNRENQPVSRDVLLQRSAHDGEF